MTDCEVSSQDVHMEFDHQRSSSSARTTTEDGDTLVATLRGPNSMSVAPQFLDAVRRARVPVRILDTASYDIEGYLVLSIVIRFAGTSAVRMMQTLLETARSLKMELDFQFPATAAAPAPAAIKAMEAAEAADDQMVSVTVIVSGTLPVGLLHNIFKCLAENEGLILEVDHRVENKITWNKQYSVFQVHVSIPWEVTLSKLYLLLREVCWRYEAEVAVREFSAMNFPSTKSLIVFGLSDVLCVGNILDNILKEAGLESPSPNKARVRTQRSQEAVATAKVRTLKGRSAVAQDRVIAQLKITPGARMVCRVLKDTGFRLAVITNSAGHAVAEAVKEELGLDYAIAPTFGVDEKGNFTGAYAGDTGDLEMRKFDFLQLLADKEGIRSRDVIVVGRFMDGLEDQLVHEILNSYGPQLYFHARKANMRGNLIVVPYLLGFTGKDIRDLALQAHCDVDDPQESALDTTSETGKQSESLTADLSAGRRCLVRVYSKSNDTSAIAKLFEPLEPFHKAGALEIISLQQVTLATYDTVLGVELILKTADFNAPLKDLLFEARKFRMEVDWDMEAKIEVPASVTSTPSDVDVDTGIGVGRYVITLMQKPELKLNCLAALLTECQGLVLKIVKLDRLSGPSHFSALRIICMVPNSDQETLRRRLLDTSHKHEVDVAIQLTGVERWGKRLIVFDMDGTLIQQVAWDELAKLASCEGDMLEIERQVKAGELDYEQGLRQRALLLKGRDATRLMEKVNRNLVYTPGAKRLCWILKRLGYTMAMICGGPIQIARQVQRALELDYVFANTPEVEPDTGKLTGRLVGPLVTPTRKRALLSMITEVEGCSLSQTVAVGDGLGDIPMISAAGLGIAFCGKKQAREAADLELNTKDLTSVIFLLGLSEAVAAHLGGSEAPPMEEEEPLSPSWFVKPDWPDSEGESGQRKASKGLVRRRSWFEGGTDRPTAREQARRTSLSGPLLKA